MILTSRAKDVLPARQGLPTRRRRAALQTFAYGVVGKEGYERIPAARRQQLRENVNTLRAQLLGAGFPPLSDDDVRGVALRRC